MYARLLLNHFKWDKEKLLECYFDSSTEKFFEDTKIGEPPAPNLVKVKEDCMMECQVCFMEYFPIEMV